jgi:hypothetical protein
VPGRDQRVSGGDLLALRTGSGNGAGVPGVEVLPANELPAGVQTPSGPRIAEMLQPLLDPVLVE